MDGKKIQNILVLIVVALVLILIASKAISNYRDRNVKWEEGDRQILIEHCIITTEDKAARFPNATLDYCTCTADTLMETFGKSEYYRIQAEDYSVQYDYFMPVILNCLNAYETRIYLESNLDDPDSEFEVEPEN